MRRCFQNRIFVKSLYCGAANGAKRGWSKAISESIASPPEGDSTTSIAGTPTRAESVGAFPGAGDEEHGPAVGREPPQGRHVLGRRLIRQNDERDRQIRLDCQAGRRSPRLHLQRTAGHVLEDTLEIIRESRWVVRGVASQVQDGGRLRDSAAR